MLHAPLAALVIILGALALAGNVGADPRFDPEFQVELTQAAPQTPSELTLSFHLENGYQLATAIFYLPLDWGVARGDQLPVGTKAGALKAREHLGLINSPCNNPLEITADLVNATINPSQTVAFGDTDEPQPPIADTPGPEPGTGGFIVEVFDTEMNSGEGIEDYAEDKDGNGLLDAIDRYPEFLIPTLGDTTPITRLAGVATIAGIPVLIQLLVFHPDTRLDLPSDVRQIMADYPQSGYPVVFVVQDFADAERRRRPGPVTDYCAPRDTSLEFAPAADGFPILVNPQSGAYAFTFVASSKRDADGDGYPNSLDTCPFVANSGDPTILSSGDEDGDGLDASCDPNDVIYEAGTNLDEDGDGFLNRQDNCPLVSNGLQDAGWTGYSGVPSEESIDPSPQSDADSDDIGDACDPDPDAPDGESIISVKTVEVVVGDASGSGGPPKAAACPQCYRLGDEISEMQGEGGQLAVAAGLIAVGATAAIIVGGSGALYLIRRRRS